MSQDQARKRAEKFMKEQERILEEHGDRVVRSKHKSAVASVQRIFQAIGSRSTNGKSDSQAKS